MVWKLTFSSQGISRISKYGEATKHGKINSYNVKLSYHIKGIATNPSLKASMGVERCIFIDIFKKKAILQIFFMLKCCKVFFCNSMKD